MTLLNSTAVTPPSWTQNRHANVRQGVQTPVVAQAGERRLSLMRGDGGRVTVTLSPPPLTHLVLSGGGAKGIAFPGMVQALEYSMALQGVRVISGSSAGAISAAVLASGMSAQAFETLSNGLNLPELLNSKDPVTAWLQNASSRLGELAGYLPGVAGSVSQLLFTLMPRLQSEAQPLEELVRNASRQSILAHIADTPRQTRPVEVMQIADKLSAGAGPTFGDLEVLSRHIPAIKQLNITGTGMFDGRPQLVVFNASLTPDMDIARAAHISGSLPVLFKSPTERGHGFQETAQVTAFQDGGLLVNTPASGVIGRTFAQSPLSGTESLVVKFESEEAAMPAMQGGLLSNLADRLTGTPHSAAGAYQTRQLEQYAEQTVTLPLRTDKGDFRGLLNGTVNFTMSGDEKLQLQKLARQAVATHLESRATVSEQHQFASLDDAVLAMDNTLLASAQEQLKKDPAASAVLMFRQGAEQALQALDIAITEANQGQGALTLTPALLSAVRNLDALASRPEQVQWLGLQLNTPGHSNFQQLLQVLAKAPATSPVVQSAVSEMRTRDIAVVADNFTREVIYPSLFRPGQPQANVALLQKAAQDLAGVTTPTQFNRVLDDITQHYAARNKPWAQPHSATTIEMAKAWRQPA
ncbi:MAG: hypothetical protein GAK37_00670 [Pseudomonas sp.]|nr:MAG: hypothetical protein GAK37_00670 [Pseudomonas sp.]